MKDTKRRVESFMFFDYAGVERHLEKMAAKGWQLESTSNWAWTYRRAEPAQLTYAVTYVPEASDWNPEPTDTELELEEFCGAAGWKKVCEWGKAQIYCTEQKDPVPLETDEAMRLDIIRKSMRKGILPGYLLLLAVFAMNIWTQWNSFRLDPVDFLAGNGIAVAGVIFWGIFIDFWSLFYYLWWSRKSERSVREGGGCVRPRYYRAMGRISWGGLVILTIGMLWGQENNYVTFMLLYTAGMFLVILILYKIRELLKRRGVSKAANWAVFLILDIMLVCVLMGVMVGGALRRDWFTRQPDEIYTDSRGWEWELYHDEMPLRVEDFVPVKKEYLYSHEKKEQSSLLLKLTEYDQREFGMDYDGQEMEYEVLEVKAGFLYDYCLESWLAAYERYHSPDGDFDLEYAVEDPGPWNADAAYRLRFVKSGEPENGWLLCKGDHIVRIETDWDMTAEMKELVLEKLELAG